MNLKSQSTDSLTLVSNSNSTTGPGNVSNDGSVFAAGDTSSRLLADIRLVAPMIATRAAEIEAARRIPLDLVEKLRSIGVFRMLAPKSHGGLELDLPEGLGIFRALGKIDGSLGSIGASLSDVVSLWREFTGHGYGDSEPLLRAAFIDYLMKKQDA